MMLDLVMLNGTDGKLIAKAPFVVVRKGDLVEIDTKSGWFVVLETIMDFDSTVKDFMLRFCDAESVDDLPSVITKKVPIDWSENDEF